MEKKEKVFFSFFFLVFRQTLLLYVYKEENGKIEGKSFLYHNVRDIIITHNGTRKKFLFTFYTKHYNIESEGIFDFFPPLFLFLFSGFLLWEINIRYYFSFFFSYLS